MSFAPYQDTSPEQERAISPPRRDFSRSPPRGGGPPTRNIAESLPAPDRFASPSGFGNEDVEASGGLLGNRASVNMFETSLPMSLDYEAAMAYVLLPPLAGVLLLVVEHKSDYVRFHAWQSSLIFALMFVLHLIFTFSAVVSWMLFAIDLIMMGFLAVKAYRDADTLDRYEMPYFGQLASSWVDAE